MSILPNKFTTLLFKPKWQHKDAAIRRIAVQEVQHEALLHELPRIAREDEDQRVRLAALRRVNDFSLYRDRAGNDPDPALRSAARTQYLGMLCGELPAPLEIAARLRELGIIEALEDIEHIAVRARDAVLRRAALERVTRASLIAERVVADPDPALRQAALDRIVDAAALERIAEKTRKTDKLISRMARERAEAQRIAGGDSGALENRARLLCEQIEALLRSSPGTREIDLAQLDMAWDGLSARAPEALRQRYAVARALLHQGMDRAANRGTREAEAAAAALAEAEAAASAPPDDAPGIDTAIPPETAAPAVELDSAALLARANFDAAVANARAEQQREREHQSALLDELKRQIESYAAALEAGDTTNARRLRGAVGAARTRLRELPPAVVQTLSRHETRFAELAQWQHWSNDKRRRELITTIEALPAAGLHPDAVANKVRDARAEWLKLDAAEELGDGAAQGMARRFQALCQQALKPTRVYFDKREEVRKSHQDQLEALLARADALTPENEDWKAIFELRRDTVLALRSQLDGVDPRQRTTLAKRLKDVIERLGARMQAHEQEIEQAKAALIAKATALAATADATNAPREVRELQKRWQAIGNGKRRTDQKQWEQFRGACDALFGNLDQARQQRETAQAAVQAQAQQLIDELESLQAALASGSTDARARQREIGSAWSELAAVDRPLQLRYQAALDAAAQAAQQQQRARRLSRYTDADMRYQLLRQLETAALESEAAQTQWDQLPAATREFADVLTTRFAAARAGQARADATVDDHTRQSARELLVQGEFLAGIESPAADRQLRMDYQVSRLSARLRGDENAAPETQLGTWLVQWFTLPALPAETALHERYQRVLQALLAQI